MAKATKTSTSVMPAWLCLECALICRLKKLIFKGSDSANLAKNTKPLISNRKLTDPDALASHYCLKFLHNLYIVIIGHFAFAFTELLIANCTNGEFNEIADYHEFVNIKRTGFPELLSGTHHISTF